MLRESETAVPSCRKSRNEGRGKTELLQSADTQAEIHGAPGRIRTWVRKPPDVQEKGQRQKGHRKLMQEAPHPEKRGWKAEMRKFPNRY